MYPCSFRIDPFTHCFLLCTFCFPYFLWNIFECMSLSTVRFHVASYICEMHMLNTRFAVICKNNTCCQLPSVWCGCCNPYFSVVFIALFCIISRTRCCCYCCRHRCRVCSSRIGVWIYKSNSKQLLLSNDILKE